MHCQVYYVLFLIKWPIYFYNRAPNCSVKACLNLGQYAHFIHLDLKFSLRFLALFLALCKYHRGCVSPGFSFAKCQTVFTATNLLSVLHVCYIYM